MHAPSPARRLRDRSAQRRRRVALALIPTALALAAGCAASRSAGPDAAAPTRSPADVAPTNAATEHGATDAAPDGSDRVESLRARAERDVATIMAGLRTADAGPEADPNTPGAPATPGTPGTPPSVPSRTGGPTAGPTEAAAALPASADATHPQIRWNDEAPPAGTAPTPADARPVARDEPTLTPVETPAALSPEERLALDELGLQLVRLRQELYRESIDSDQPVRELLAIAAMSIIDPELELPSGIGRDLSEEELDLLERLHEFFAAIGTRLEDREARTTVVEAVDELRAALDRRPPLLLPTVAFCWRIDGFGTYEAFERNAFLAHAESRLILYLEIDGFASEQNPRGEWVTEISQQLEIYSDRDGIPVWSEPWEKAVDVTQKKRRDFFTTQLVTLPRALSVGRYHLKIRVRDEHSGAEAEESVAFEMVADPKLAASVGGRRD